MRFAYPPYDPAHDLSFGPAHAVRDAVVLSRIDMRERGAWDAPWGSSLPACAGDARLHAPRIGRSFPARDHGVGATYQVAVHQGVFAPGSLAPRRLPVPRVRRHIRASSWPLRFLAPEAIATPFVSPHNQHGSHRPYCSATLQSWDLLNRTRDRSPSPEAVQPRRPTPRHPEFGRLRISLRQGVRIIRRVEGVGDNFPICFRQNIGIAGKLLESAPEDMLGSSGFAALGRRR